MLIQKQGVFERVAIIYRVNQDKKRVLAFLNSEGYLPTDKKAVHQSVLDMARGKKSRDNRALDILKGWKMIVAERRKKRR